MAFDELKLEALKVSCGKDHTLVLARERNNGKVRLYSIGKDDQNYKVLGISQ
jgi:hypothetical protein